MKLKQNQLNLISHLIQFGILDYLSCLRLLDTDKTADKTALSYAFRPLTKNKYIAKHKENVNILAKGRSLFPEVKPLVSIGGGISSVVRVNSVSKMAALMRMEEIEITDLPHLLEYESFVPSASFRKIRTNILSTVRFAGMLFLGEHRLAVYDIGDGIMEWQLRAERSLFYLNFFEEFDTHATGILLICDDDKRIDVAKRIIRETMRQRKRLIEHESYYQRERPVKFSKSPIRLAWYYKHVYLTTPDMLSESLDRIREENNFIKQLCGNREILENQKQGDFEDYPYRYFVNPSTDLLKFTYFFTVAKSKLPHIKYAVVLPKYDFPILQVYSDVAQMEGLKTYEC